MTGPTLRRRILAALGDGTGLLIVAVFFVIAIFA